MCKNIEFSAQSKNEAVFIFCCLFQVILVKLEKL